MVPRLMAVYARMDLLWFLRDTRYCLLDIFSQTVSTLAAVSAVMLVSLRFGGIGGMTAGQVLFMMGYGTLAEGIVNLFFGGSNSGHISRIIGRGQLDHLLAVPAPIWVQLLTQGFIPVSGGNVFVCGIIMTAWSASRLHVAVTVPWLFLLALNLAASVAAIMSVVYIISCCAFFAPAAAEEISMPVHELFQTLKGYPLGGAWRTRNSDFLHCHTGRACRMVPGERTFGKNSGRPAPVAHRDCGPAVDRHGGSAV